MSTLSSQPLPPPPPASWEPPPPAPVPVNEGRWGAYELAGWWSRAIAQLLDALITSAMLLPFIIVVLAIAGVSYDEGADTFDSPGLGAAIIVLVVGSIAVGILYAPLLMRREGERNGQTWGMQAMGIRIVRDNGQAFTFGPAFVREYLVKGLLFGSIGTSLCYIPFLANYLWPLWDDSNRALHDMICSTHAVRA